RANAAAAEPLVDGEIENVQAVLMQLIDHEADDPLAGFGHHADAVALAKAAEKIVLVPGKLKTLLLDRQHFGHVAANHPANVHRQMARRGGTLKRFSRPGHGGLLRELLAAAIVHAAGRRRIIEAAAGAKTNRDELGEGERREGGGGGGGKAMS